MLDAGAETGLIRGGGHGCMVSGWLGIAMPNFGWIEVGFVFKKTVFSFQGFDPSVPHVPHVGGKILR